MSDATQLPLVPADAQAELNRLGREARDLFRQMTTTRNGRRTFGRQWAAALDAYKEARQRMRSES